MSEIEHYAGAIAAIVERLRGAVARGVAMRQATFVEDWELTGDAASILVNLRHTLPDRVALWANVAAVYVYKSPSTVMRGVDDLLGRGLIETTTEGPLLTSTGREAILELHRITSKVTDELWGASTTVCEDLLPLLQQVVAAAAETGGEAFDLFYPPFASEDASSPMLVATLLSPLHFHRFDAHVSAWRTAGLSAQEAQLLTGGALWRVLQDETNLRDAAPYSTLKAKQRIDLMASLGSLPG